MIRYELQFAGIDVGFAEGLGSVDIGLGQGFPDIAILVLQHAIGRQFGDGQAQIGGRGVGIGDAEVGPGQHQVGILGAGHGAAGGDWRFVADDGGGHTAIVANHQVFEIATGSRTDLHIEGLSAFGDAVTQDRHTEGAGIAAFRNRHGGHAGEVRAIFGGTGVAQRDGDVRFSLAGQRQGVVGGLTFGNRGSAGDADRSGVGGIGHVGDSGLVADLQFFEIATVGTGDGRTDVACIDVHIVAWRINGDAAGGLVGGDDDGLAVAQGHGNRSAGRVGQGGGVGDLATFIDRRGCRQFQGGGVDGIGHLGDRSGTVD
ncbi:hypothetical protein D3C80_1073600 [compost metagenome]